MISSYFQETKSKAIKSKTTNLKTIDFNTGALYVAIVTTTLISVIASQDSRAEQNIQPTSQQTPKLSLNLHKDITVSGVSSGGYMANQFHIAHSDLVSGIGIVSAGPYYCSEGNLMIAMQQCLADGTKLENKDLLASMRKNARKELISPLYNLKSDRIWLMHGTLDKRVAKNVNEALLNQYRETTTVDHIQFVQDKAFNHHLPTKNIGIDCTKTETPFLGNCNYDTAGELLNWITDEKIEASNEKSLNVQKYKTPSSKGKLYTLAQPPQIKDAATGLSDVAYVYVPAECSMGANCQIHVSFHGCQQNAASINGDYVLHSGFNDWADKLNLVVVYPQIASGNPLNPLACWDWWGYTGINFHTQSGPQIQAIYQLTQNLKKQHSVLSPVIKIQETLN